MYVKVYNAHTQSNFLLNIHWTKTNKSFYFRYFIHIERNYNNKIYRTTNLFGIIIIKNFIFFFIFKFIAYMMRWILVFLFFFSRYCVRGFLVKWKLGKNYMYLIYCFSSSKKKKKKICFQRGNIVTKIVQH